MLKLLESNNCSQLIVCLCRKLEKIIYAIQEKLGIYPTVMIRE